MRAGLALKKHLKKKALHTSGDTAEHTLSFCRPVTVTRLVRPIETERRAHHGDHVEVPDEFLARGRDEPLRGVDLALLAVALEHFEARASARLVEVREGDSIGDGLVVYLGWSNWHGSLAHHVVLRWVTRAFRRRLDSHVDVVRRRGRRSGARVSGRLLYAKPKIGLSLSWSSIE
eukprot:scaffold6362_cov123-Isochrysis_galbana.AAC.6